MGAVWGTAGLNLALVGSVVLGTMYSLPPIRLKRFPLLAALCIVVVRGTLINVGFFAHAQAAVFSGSASALSSSYADVLHTFLNDPKCMLSSLFYGVFGIVIALMKDVPDVTGDSIANIKSFSVRIGQTKIFRNSRRLLSLLLFGFGGGFLFHAIKGAPSSTTAACRAVVGCTSVFAGLEVRRKAVDVNPEDSEEVFSYYMYLWKIFYLSYLALPFAR